jgi:hypothetical protein
MLLGSFRLVVFAETKALSATQHDGHIAVTSISPSSTNEERLIEKHSDEPAAKSTSCSNLGGFREATRQQLYIASSVFSCQFKTHKSTAI